MKIDCALECKQQIIDNGIASELAKIRVTVLTEQNYLMCHIICGNIDIDLRYYRCAIRSK